MYRYYCHVLSTQPCTVGHSRTGIVFSGNFPTPLVSIVTSLIHITLLPSAQLLCSFNARSTVRCTHLNLQEMSLQIIDEDNTLEPLANCETQPHDRTGRGFHGNRPNDSVSIVSHSTNSTASNLVGTGRVLGTSTVTRGNVWREHWATLLIESGLVQRQFT